MQITFAVPRETTTCFVIAVDRAPTALSSVVPWRMSRPHRREAAEALGTPRLTISRYRIPRSSARTESLSPSLSPALSLTETSSDAVDASGVATPSPSSPRHEASSPRARTSSPHVETAIAAHPAGVLQRGEEFPAGEEERARLRRARHHVVISSTVSPSCQPRAAQVARAAARAVAGAYGGVIVDPLTGGLIVDGPDRRAEPTTFRLADDWLGWRVGIDDEASCPPWDPGSSESCTCLSVTTRGLSRFGLPEIMLAGAACAHSLCTVDVLRMVAQRLLTGHLAWLAGNPTGGVRTIADHMRIDESDYTMFGGTASAGVVGEPFPGEPFPAGPYAAGPFPAGPFPAGSYAAAPSPGGLVRGGPFGGEAEFDGRSFLVRLSRHAPDRGCLQVGPPEGFDGNLNEWLYRACGEALPWLRLRAA